MSDHFEKNNPGKVTNEEVLNMEPKYLKGTGKLKGFETEVIDTYLNKNMREKTNYEFWSEELWNYVKSRYGCDHEIKRFYHKQGSYYSLTEVEARYKEIPVFIVRTEDLYGSKYTNDTFQINYVNMAKKANYSDFKRRMVDICEARGGKDLKLNDIRLW